MNRIAKKRYNLVSTSLCLLLSGVSVGWLIGLSVSPVVYTVIASLVAVIVSIASTLAGIKIANEDLSNEAPKSRKLNVEVNPIPIAAALVGIAIGASIGIYGRTNGWLGPNAGRIAEQWQDTGLDRKEIFKRLFDTLYPPTSNAPGRDATAAPQVNGNQSSSPGSSNANTSVSTNSNIRPTNSNTNSGSEAGKKPPQTNSVEAPAQNTGSNAAVSELAARRLSGVLFTVTSSDCTTFRTASEERLAGLLTNYRDKHISDAAKECNARVECLKEVVRIVCAKK
jgi:hypothetical protein